MTLLWKNHYTVVPRFFAGNLLANAGNHKMLLFLLPWSVAKHFKNFFQLAVCNCISLCKFFYPDFHLGIHFLSLILKSIATAVYQQQLQSPQTSNISQCSPANLKKTGYYYLRFFAMHNSQYRTFLQSQKYLIFNLFAIEIYLCRIYFKINCFLEILKSH